MVRKPKLELKITRIKLNPEQAVLACSCWHAGYRHNTSLGAHKGSGANWCNASARGGTLHYWWSGSASIS